MSLKVVISPAKKLNFDDLETKLSFQAPVLMDKTTRLAKAMKKMSAKKIGKLMNLSPELSLLNYDRYQDFEIENPEEKSACAMHVFNGEVYSGLAARDFNKEQTEYASRHLFILSGLYGLLKSTDFIQPYRLEMGTKLQLGVRKNLYEFWGKDITNALKNELAKEDTIVNLASNEYFKSVQTKEISNRIITPTFKEFKNGDFKTVMVFAKKARGLMSRFIIENEISEAEHIKAFDVEGYNYNESLSTENEWVFTR